MYLTTKVKVWCDENRIVAKSLCCSQSGNYNPHLAPSWSFLTQIIVAGKITSDKASHSLLSPSMCIYLETVCGKTQSARCIITKTCEMSVSMFMGTNILYHPVILCMCVVCHACVYCTLQLDTGWFVQGPESESLALISLILPLGTPEENRP